jgi:hypothetical protein
MDEREHAIMQGKALLPHDEDITPRKLLVEDNTKIMEHEICNDESEAISGKAALSKSNVFGVVYVQRLMSWYLLLLALLRLANFLNPTTITSHS